MITHNTYTFTGKIVYKDDGWVIIEGPSSIVNYYKFWCEKFTGKKLSTSYHRPHVSLIAGKYDKGCEKHKNWKKYDGLKVIVTYESNIYTDDDWFFAGKYFWLRVHCPMISVIRTGLGLSPNPFHHPHFTIGYCGQNE